jgi:predicted outer membrane protein
MFCSPPGIAGTAPGARASNDAVRQFGQRMAADHGKANEELMQLAKNKNLSLSTESR